MTVLIKPWKAILPGDTYESDLFVGDECPKELISAASEAGVVDVKPVKMEASSERFERQLKKAKGK